MILVIFKLKLTCDTGYFNVRNFTVTGDVKQTIFDFMTSQNIDMMAMLTYKRHFLEGLFDQSLTKKLSYHSEIPLFALHEK